MMGIALDDGGVFRGSLLDLLHPYALLAGLVTTALFAMHGSIYLFLKLPKGEARERVRGWMWHTWGVFLVLYILGTMYTLVAIPRATANFRALSLGGDNRPHQCAGDRKHPAIRPSESTDSGLCLLNRQYTVSGVSVRDGVVSKSGDGEQRSTEYADNLQCRIQLRHTSNDVHHRADRNAVRRCLYDGGVLDVSGARGADRAQLLDLHSA